MYFDLTKGNLSFIGKTRHHQDFHLNDAWFMFSNPVRQMPYISNFRGLLFYGHLSKAALFFIGESISGRMIFEAAAAAADDSIPRGNLNSGSGSVGC